MRRVQTNESNQCDLRGSLFAWLVCFLIKIISPGSRFGVFLVFGEALGKVPGLICSSQAVPRLAVGDGKEVATIGFKGFHSVSSWNRLMRTDAVSFVVWWMPSTAGREHPARIGIILSALHQETQAAQAASEMVGVVTAAFFRRAKRSPMAPMSARAPNPTTRWAVSTSQCRSPARIICCVTPKIGTMNA